MKDDLHPAPLVALSDEQAAQNMISEGSPVPAPTPPSPGERATQVLGHLQHQAEHQFYAHPLRTLLVAFGVGVLIGAAARRSSCC